MFQCFLWGVKAALALIGFATAMLVFGYVFVTAASVIFRRRGKQTRDRISRWTFWSKN